MAEEATHVIILLAGSGQEELGSIMRVKLVAGIFPHQSKIKGLITLVNPKLNHGLCCECFVGGSTLGVSPVTPHFDLNHALPLACSKSWSCERLVGW